MGERGRGEGGGVAGESRERERVAERGTDRRRMTGRDGGIMIGGREAANGVDAARATEMDCYRVHATVNRTFSL